MQDHGALASSFGLHGWTEPFIPLTRRETYLVMGWKYQPPLTEEEVAGMRRVMEAMSRIGDRHVEQHGNITTCFMGEEYFKELGANLREIDAEVRSAGPASGRPHVTTLFSASLLLVVGFVVLACVRRGRRSSRLRPARSAWSCIT